MNNISFLLGSGVSIPSGMPSTFDITSIVMSGKKIIRHTDSTYYLLAEDEEVGFNQYPDHIPIIVEFLNLIQNEIEKYYRIVNYEDLYYVVNQLYESEIREYENPIVYSYIEKLRPLLNDILGKYPNSKLTLVEVFQETINYIKDITWRALSLVNANTTQFEIIKNAINSNTNLDIFTLNHDTLVEEFFDSNNIDYSDGFNQAETDVYFWNNSFDSLDKVGVNLFKLHGSIDWFRFRSNRGAYYDDKIGIPVIKDYWHTKDENDEYRTPLEGRPIFLAGTFNKILQYTNEIYFDLHYQFVSKLRRTNRLIVSGYGFGDKAINYQIVKWMFENPDNLIHIIHRKPNNLKYSSRGAIARNWDEWEKRNQLIVTKKHIDELDENDIHSIINR